MKPTLYALVTLLAIYALGAFATGQWDARFWEPVVQCITAICGVGMAGFSWGLSKVIEETNKQR